MVFISTFLLFELFDIVQFVHDSKPGWFGLLYVYLRLFVVWKEKTQAWKLILIVPRNNEKFIFLIIFHFISGPVWTRFVIITNFPLSILIFAVCTWYQISIVWQVFVTLLLFTGMNVLISLVTRTGLFKRAWRSSDIYNLELLLKILWFSSVIFNNLAEIHFSFTTDKGSFRRYYYCIWLMEDGIVKSLSHQV